MILQGRIICTSERNASQLINDVERIALAQTRMVIQNNQLTTLNYCSVQLSELGQEPECVEITNHSNKSKDYDIIGGTVGGVFFVCLIVGVIITWRCKKR